MTSATFHETHNDAQRAYFERELKPTMVPSGSRYVRRQVDEVLRAAGVTATDLVLDAGCGMGRYTISLAERGVRVEGLDLTQGLLDRLRGYASGRFDIPLHCADIMAPPAALHARYDAVVGFFALHHMHDLDACFAGVARMVKPGGRVVFLEPNPWNVLYTLQITFTPRMRWSREKGVLDMTRTKIFGACERAGLVRTRLERFGFFPPFVTNTAVGAALERPLERFPPFRPFLPFQMFSAERP